MSCLLCVLLLTTCHSTDKFDEQRRHWGGGVRGNKSTAMMRKRAKALGQTLSAEKAGKL